MVPERRTSGSIESAIAVALTQFERDWLGRGPKDSRVHLVRDMVLARLRGVLSPAEQQLAGQPGGVALLKEMRSRLIEGAREDLVRLVETNTGAKVLSMHTDLSVPTGERVFVFVLDREFDAR
jgi:uncharacterized protein YbcI